jgi:HEAT repeat protein
VSTLLDLLNDPHAQIRAYAARSLSKLHDPGTLPKLFAYLEQTRKTGDKTELYHAARAVGDFGVPAAIEKLLFLRERSVSRSVHCIVVDVLSRQGEQMLPVLLEVLADQTRPEQVRNCIREALARKPRPEWFPVLTPGEEELKAHSTRSASQEEASQFH